MSHHTTTDPPPLPADYTPARIPHQPRPTQTPRPTPVRVPVGPLLSGPLTTTTGAHDQPVSIHRQGYRHTSATDTAPTAHGHAYRCHACGHIGGAHDHYTVVLDAAEYHACQEEAPNA